ncbi:hypothetical protein BVX93_01690 [bacterium B13(2017)]|nr:hypothetical protein BVX93_01690 [bacterium B13(2017)]
MDQKTDFIEFIELLNKEKVKYVIVGGYAISYHIHPRATGDIDFYYDLDKDNCIALMKVLESFAGKSNITIHDLCEPGKITMIGLPPNRIDLINKISGLNFNEAWNHKVNGSFGGLETWYISKNDLLKNKKASNRPKDQIDIEWLSD